MVDRINVAMIVTGCTFVGYCYCRVLEQRIRMQQYQLYLDGIVRMVEAYCTLPAKRRSAAS